MLATTPLTHIPLLFDTLLTLLLFTLGAALGLRLLRWLRISVADTLERGIFAATLGMGALSFLPFVLFAVGIGRPVVVMSAVCLLVLLLWKDMVRTVRGALGALSKAFRTAAAAGFSWGWLLALACGLQLLPLFLQALCPPTDPDGLFYHLTGPLRYLDLGHFAYMPTFLQLNWPLGVEMLFGVGLAFNTNYAASLIPFSFGLLLLLSVYVVGRRLASPIVGGLAAVLTLFWVRSVMSVAYVDVALAQYTLLSVYAFFLGWKRLQPVSDKGVVDDSPAVTFFQEEKDLVNSSLQQEDGAEAASRTARMWWRLSALLMGLAASAKLSALAPLVLMTGLVFWTEWRLCRRLRGTGKAVLALPLRSAALYLVWGLLVVGPWYLRTWFETGDPLYPLFWSIFKPRDWNLITNLRMNEYVQYLVPVPSLHLTPENMRKLRLVVLGMVAISGLCVSFWRGTRDIRPLVVFLFAALFCQVGSVGIYLRYLIPFLPIAMLLLVWVFRGVLARSDTWRWVGAALVVLALWAPPKRQLSRTIAGIRTALPVACGAVTHDAYLTREVPIYPVMQWSNENLPPDAVVVLGLAHDAYASLLHRKALVTGVWLQGALRFDDWGTLLADLHRHGATHLMVLDEKPSSPTEIAAMGREDQVRATLEYPQLERLRTRYGVPIYHHDGYTVYALQWDNPHLP